MPNSIIGSSLLLIVKLFLLTLLFLFIVFSVIVVRQVQLMTKVLTVPISGSLKFVALGLLLFAIGIFIFALLIL